MRIPEPEVATMFCKYCGKETGEGAEFCAACGEKFHGEGHAGLNRDELTHVKAPKETKNPKAAASLGYFLSWIFLGPVGYLYLGQRNWFWLTLAIQIVAIPMTLFTAFFMLPLVYGIHQYDMAKNINKLLAVAQGAKPDAPAGESVPEAFGKLPE
jgi:hypothetical protein